MKSWKWAVPAVAMLGLGAIPGSRADDSRRLDDDVSVRVSAFDRRSPSPAARVRVRNRGRNDQQGVLVTLRAGSADGEVLGSWTADVPAGRAWTVRARV